MSAAALEESAVGDGDLLSTRSQSRKRSIGDNGGNEGQKDGAPQIKRFRSGGAAITTQGKFPTTAGAPPEELTTNTKRKECSTTGKRRSCYPKELAVDRNLIRISMSPDEPERPKQPSTSDSQLHVDELSSSNDKDQMLLTARSKKDPTPPFSEIQQTAAATTPTDSANPKKQPLISKAAGDSASDLAVDDKERSQNHSSSAGPWNIPPRKMTQFWRLSTAVIVVLVGIAVAAPAFQAPMVKSSQHTARSQQQQQEPDSPWWYWGSSEQRAKKAPEDATTNAGGVVAEPKPPLSLRDILMDHENGFHLAMAPAFFGFYGYFGTLAGWFDAVREGASNDRPEQQQLPIKSVAGASAGAMTAILLAAGIAPQVAADFCADMTVGRFADFPGFGAVFRGNKFEAIMHEFMTLQNSTGRMEDAILPVAVTAFDLQTMRGQVLETGSMARAARASATFPGLFQPVAWEDATNDYIFIDGGIADPAGLMGLHRTMPSFAGDGKVARVINLSVGGFLTSIPPGPSSLPGNPEVISISLLGTPMPGPWALENGPKAFRAAREAMTAALDVPLQRVAHRRKKGSGDSKAVHYELVVDASSLKKG